MPFKNTDVDSPLEAVLSAAVDAIVVIDDHGIIQQVSDSVERLFGYCQGECVGNNVSLLMPEPDRSAHDGYLASYLAGGEARVMGIGRNTNGRKKSGEIFPMHLSVGETWFRDRTFFVGICHDLSQHHSVLAQLSSAEQRYREIIENQKHLICRLDAGLQVTFANAAFERVLGINRQELPGVTLNALVAEEDQNVHSTLASLFAGQDDVREVNIKVTMRYRNQPVLVDWSFRRVEDAHSRDREVQGFGVDVTDQAMARNRADYLRDHDQLTGLLNARSLLSQFEGWASRNLNYGFFRIDLNRFGPINQRYGREAGDRVITEAARRIETSVQRRALIARPGGDDFQIACVVRDRTDAAELARSLALALSGPFVIAGDAHILGARVGVALYPLHASKPQRLAEFAEAAMEEARQTNEQIRFFDDHSHAQLLRQLAIEQALKTAMADNAIAIHLQPKVSLLHREVEGFEALARWTHPELGEISPAEFIPIVEQAGLGREFDRYIISRVADLMAWMTDLSSAWVPVAINVTARHFSCHQLFRFIESTLAEYSLPATAFQLEITENVVVDMTQVVSDNLEKLRRMGLKISIDDFGTGYSSLSYLRQLAVDELKIDKSFIDGLNQTAGAGIVQSIIGLARACGLSTVAEGVETAGQAELLRGMGCETGQGYLFSRPLPPAEALAWMRNYHAR